MLLADHVCLFDGKCPVNVPLLAEDQGLQLFNVLLTHLLAKLSGSQGLAAFTIAPSKRNTVNALLERTLPAIPSTDNLPTPFVSPRTIAYIHGLIIDSVSALHTESVHRRALRTESMALKELESMSLVDFHKELRVVLTSYYEDIVKMDGAGGLDRNVAYKRPIKRLEVPLPPAGEGAAAEANGGAAAAEVANASEQAPPPEPAPGEPAAAPAKAAPAPRGRRAGGT